jgi:hypothetical protein
MDTNEVRKMIDVHRTALALFRAAARDDDEGLALLQAIQDPADTQLVSAATERIVREAQRVAPAVGLEDFYGAYSAAIDATEEQILGG